MNEKAKEFLYQYINNAAPTGFETSGQQLWLNYISPYIDEYISDVYGTVVGVVNPNKPYKVVIEAHADEISWFVNYITEEGYIYVCRNGGSDAVIAPSKRVFIHTKKGKVPAVFGWPAIHVRDTAKEEVPSMEKIFLDCGAKNKQEVLDMGVHVGCVITFQDELIEMNQRWWVGRALDNRIGGFAIAEVARAMKEDGFLPDYTLYIVNAVQEEVGLRGAEMIAARLKPDVAIIVDVCHDTTAPLYNKVKSGLQKCGEGPVLSYAPAVHNTLRDMLIEIAEKNQIPFQRMASSRATGTDTDAFAYSSAGIASALISIPLKYMHTTVEMVDKADVENVTKLITAFLKELPAGKDFRYIQ
jgi:putative aminopeptidase FrvX